MDNPVLGNNVQFAKLPFREFVKTQVDLGVKAIDFTLMTPHIYVDSYEVIDCSDALESLSKAAIRVHTVTPMAYRYSICADSDSIQNERTLDYYRQCICLAEKIGAEYVTVTASGANYDYEKTRLLTNAQKSLDILSEFALAHGRTLLLGTVLGEESPYNATTPVLVSLNEVADMIKTVGSHGLKAYLDVEVISLVGETITQWFDTLGSDIKLVRFTDGNYNGYRIWTKGCLPCDKYLSQLKEAGYTGALSTQIPGERYAESPAEAEKEMLLYLNKKMREVGR